MIPLSTTRQVRRLLAQRGLSQRKIAELTGVSRGTVGAIASGKRPDYDPPPSAENELHKPSGPARRCPVCGATVYMPCRACGVREQTARRSADRLLRLGAVPEEALKLDLRGEHRLRYELVRARRAQRQQATQPT